MNGQLLFEKLFDIIFSLVVIVFVFQAVFAGSAAREGYMKRVLISVLSLCFIFTGCSPICDKGDNRIVAQANGYKMTIGDLRYELKNVPYDDERLLDTEQGKEEYLSRLLEKEILLQEAQRQGLDREKDFMKTIENYWEQALLKLLLEKKSREISGKIHVYENEVRDYYEDSGETLSFSRVRMDIERTIRRQRETEAMDTWIKELRDKSYVEINKEILDDAFSAK